MFQALHFRADASCGLIGRVLLLHPARTLAVVLPAGMRTALAQPNQLEELYVRCTQAHKDVTIVGGDALLRAYAVAAGFSAATTVADWKQDRGQQRAAEPPFAVGEPSLIALGTPHHDGELTGISWGDEPPTHIVELLDVPAPHEQRSRISHPVSPFTAAELDVMDAEAVQVASEAYEDKITARIRDTSGYDFPWAI